MAQSVAFAKTTLQRSDRSCRARAFSRASTARPDARWHGSRDRRAPARPALRRAASRLGTGACSGTRSTPTMPTSPRSSTISGMRRKLKASARRSVPKFSPQHGADVALFARKFFRELFARAKGPMALVLDSLQAVPADSALYTALEAAIRSEFQELLRRDHEPQRAPGQPRPPAGDRRAYGCRR